MMMPLLTRYFGSKNLNACANSESTSFAYFRSKAVVNSLEHELDSMTITHRFFEAL